MHTVALEAQLRVKFCKNIYFQILCLTQQHNALFYIEFSCAILRYLSADLGLCLLVTLLIHIFYAIFKKLYLFCFFMELSSKIYKTVLKYVCKRYRFCSTQNGINVVLEQETKNEK